MLKNILNLKGAHQLSENEQQSINGGARVPSCKYHADCPNNPNADCCWQGICISSQDERCAGIGG